MKPAVLITGGAKRIGAALARSFAEAGYDVAIHYNSSALEATQLSEQLASLGGNVSLFQANLSDIHAAHSLIPAVIKHFPNLSLLINNASLFEKNGIVNTDPEQLQNIFAVNFLSAYVLSRSFYTLLANGHIINMLDKKIDLKTSKYAAYTMSKKSLADFTVMAAREFAPSVRVNGIALWYALPPDNLDLNKSGIVLPTEQDCSVEDIVSAAHQLEKNSALTGEIVYLGK